MDRLRTGMAMVVIKKGENEQTRIRSRESTGRNVNRWPDNERRRDRRY